MGKVSFPTGRFVGLKMWWAYAVNSIRRYPKGYLKALCWRNWYNSVLPEKLRYRLWYWCFPECGVSAAKK